MTRIPVWKAGPGCSVEIGLEGREPGAWLSDEEAMAGIPARKSDGLGPAEAVGQRDPHTFPGKSPRAGKGCGDWMRLTPRCLGWVGRWQRL